MVLRIVLYWQGPRQHTVKRATGPSQTIGRHHPNHDTLSHTITLIKMLNTTYNLQNTTYCEFIGCSNDLLASGFSIFPRQLIQPISHGVHTSSSTAESSAEIDTYYNARGGICWVQTNLFYRGGWARRLESGFSYGNCPSATRGSHVGPPGLNIEMSPCVHHTATAASRQCRL